MAASSNAPQRRKNVRKDSGVGRNIMDTNHVVSFQKQHRRRVKFAPMDKALVFISQKSEFWTPPNEELPSPNGATVSHQYFLHVSDDYIFSRVFQKLISLCQYVIQKTLPKLFSPFYLFNSPMSKSEPHYHNPIQLQPYQSAHRL